MCVAYVPSSLSFSLAPFSFFPPLFHLWSSSQMWSCPGQDEWPGVTSSICPRGWIYLPRVSLKGHTIKYKQSSEHAYLEDREGENAACPPGNSLETLLNANRVQQLHDCHNAWQLYKIWTFRSHLHLHLHLPYQKLELQNIFGIYCGSKWLNCNETLLQVVTFCCIVSKKREC